MSEVTVPVKPNGHNRTSRKQRTLEDFARGIEAKLRQGCGPDAIANYICRLLTSSDEKVAAMMLCKWVQWRYGKAKEHLEHTGPDCRPVPIQIISYVPRPGDPEPTTLLAERELAEPAGAEALPADDAEPDDLA